MSATPTIWSPPISSPITSEPDTPSSGSISSSPPPPQPTSRTPGGGGGSPPPPPPGCAACKHKRQKCPPGCVLLPFFPASEPDKFRNVLRVFGVKNLLRTLREVPRPRWDACVRTLVYESRARLADPVRGLVGAIEELESQLMDTAVELVVLRRRLESYRQAKQQALIINRIQPPTPIHGPHGRVAAAAAASAQRVTDPDLGVTWQQTGRMTRDDVMETQGAYYGEVWTPTAMAGLTSTTTPQLFAMQPQFSARQPQLSATPSQLFSAMPPQVYATTQPQFLARHAQTQFLETHAQPQTQLPAMQQQLATAIVRDGFGNPWANDDQRRGDPDDM